MKKKIFAISMLTTSILSSVGGINTFAAEQKQTQDTPVSYTAEKLVVSNDFIAAIPIGIKFSDANRKMDVSIRLTDKEGRPYAGPAINVDGEIQSKNGFNLVVGDGKDALPYDLTYAGNKLEHNTTKQKIGTLSKDNLSIEGSAELPSTSVASVSGEHTDTLTYTLTKR